MEFEIKKNGKFISQDELFEKATEELKDIIEDMSLDDLLDVLNYYRDEIGEELVREFNEESVDDALEDWSPWEILNLGHDISWHYDYFRMTSYGDLEGTDDVAEGLDLSDVAAWLLKEGKDEIIGEYYLDREALDLIEAYEAAAKKLDSYLKYAGMLSDTLEAFKNCKADQFDLVYAIEKVLRDCDIVAKSDDEEE